MSAGETKNGCSSAGSQKGSRKVLQTCLCMVCCMMMQVKRVRGTMTIESTAVASLTPLNNYPGNTRTCCTKRQHPRVYLTGERLFAGDAIRHPPPAALHQFSNTRRNSLIHQEDEAASLSLLLGA